LDSNSEAGTLVVKRDKGAQDRESGAPPTEVVLGDLWEMTEQNGSNDD
jgi:hypothetical protein